jgi:acyl-CoA synthetase (AMP-forming)/AMP-acid ligase II
MSETVLHCWRALVRAHPEATALIDGADGCTWTRAALSEAASGWLRALPAETRAALARRRVIMTEPNGARWFHVFLGLLEAGAIPAPADARETPATLRATAAACSAAWLWHEGALENIPLSPPPPRARRRDLCLVKLTSGSTGTPKALVFTHAQMLADGRQLAAAMDIRPGDLNLAVIPLGHSYGLGNLVMPLLAQGTPVLCAASPLPRALAADCERWRPTIFPAVPTLLRALAQTDIAPAALAGLRAIISAGAPLAPETAAAFAQKFSRNIHAFYGASETGGITYDRTGRAALTAGNVGTPVNGVTLRWRRGGRFAVAGAAVHGRGVCPPPDRATLNARGELILLGRAGRFAKIAGRRVNLAEVENALRALPGVTGAFVAGHPSRPDTLAAAVEIHGSADILVRAPMPASTPAALRAALAPRLAAWKIPARIRVLREFPVTARGKPDRRALTLLLAEKK